MSEEEKIEEVVEEVVTEEESAPIQEEAVVTPKVELSDILCADCGGVMPAEDAAAGKTICPKCYGYDKQ
jgi:formylmethanofuran dehydrogenase subunit E